MGAFFGVGASGSVGPTSGGKVTPFNTVTTSGQQVIAANQFRSAITFVNPNDTIDVYVYPLVQASGAALAPSLASRGGTFKIVSGGMLTLVGEIQGAWGAFGSNTGALTIMESNVAS